MPYCFPGKIPDYVINVLLHNVMCVRNIMIHYVCVGIHYNCVLKVWAIVL